MSFLQRLTRPLRWRSPRRTAQHLLAFSRAERSSFYDLMVAAQGSPDPARRAQYLVHATDEARHAGMFARRATELCPEVARDPRATYADCEQLYERLGEVRFLAFVHHGECRGQARLRAFRDEHAQRGDDKTSALLDVILRDEAQHAAYTRRLLDELCPRSVRWELFRARRWEWGRQWLRAGSSLSQALFDLSMRCLYLAFFPLAWLLQAREKKAKRAVLRAQHKGRPSPWR